MDETGFTAYIQGRLHLYAPAPVNIAGPLTLSFGTFAHANALLSL